MDKPFMEHPSGEFDSAVYAISDAVARLRNLSEWNSWITFTAQGQGGRVDSYRFAQIRMRGDELSFEKPLDLDVANIAIEAGASSSSLVKKGSVYSVRSATPQQVAAIMDIIYRKYLGIRPHEGEGTDYAIGAEW